MLEATVISIMEMFVHWGWTVPGGSVRPGQSVDRLKQASLPSPKIKNQFNIGARQCPACQILS